MKSAIRIVLVAAFVAALSVPLMAQQADHQSASNPLVQLLQSKGILSAEEAATVQSAATTAEANERLARLLWSKGLISQEEYNETVAAAAAAPASASNPSGARMVNASVPATPAAAAVNPSTDPSAKSAPWPVSVNAIGTDYTDGTAADAGTIPAVAPIRVLPIGLPRDPKSIIPDIRLGSGAMLNAYGFLKASAVYDSTNSGGATFGNNDFPLPLLLGDTGPDAGSQFRIKARSTRAGVNFFYPLSGPDITLTGKVEFDWEGDYTIVNNRNISAIRSSQLSLRLAWARMDTKLGGIPWFAEFGQDWTLLGSSTVQDLFETTGFGVGLGNFYERLPQFKTGLQFTAGSMKIQPEFAIVLGAFGDSNINSAVDQTLLGALGAVPIGQQNQGREGAILGSASGQPGVQGRIVFDFPLNSNWKGVPHSEIIFSGGHSEGQYITPLGNIPTTAIAALQTVTNAQPSDLAANSCATATTAGFSIQCYYPTGINLRVPSNAFSAELQLPTPWVTFIGKYYRGDDLRFMFAGQLNTAFRDTQAGPVIEIPGTLLCTGTGAVTAPCPAGTTNIPQTVTALSGDAVTFSSVGGAAVVDPYRPIRGQGGVVQLAFPLSRIFGADPEGRNSGWQLFAGYGVDSAFARDVIRAGGDNLQRSDYAPVSLRYRINKWAQIVNEVTWYDTRTADSKKVDYRGIPAHVNHDIRNEFGTIFTF